MRIFLDYHSRTPIYEQIEEQIAGLVSSGVLKANEQLPSLRQLSAELSININTIKRALSDLEAQGITYSVAGKGIFISGNTQKNAILDSVLVDVKKAIAKAKAMGAHKKDLQEILDIIFKGDEKND